MKGELGKVQVHQFTLSQKVGSQSTRGLQRISSLNTGVMKCKVMKSSKRDKEKLFDPAHSFFVHLPLACPLGHICSSCPFILT
jgi:hypothetical protein